MSNQPYPPDQPEQGYPQREITPRPYQPTPPQQGYQQPSYRDPMSNQVESRQQIVEDQNLSRANVRYWVRAITYFVLSVLEIILLLRFVFRLLGANAYNSFVDFLYGLSHPFVAPFNGIFNDQTLGKVSVFEVSTLIAMLIYALLAWGIVSLVNIIFAPVSSSRQSITTTRRGPY